MNRDVKLSLNIRNPSQVNNDSLAKASSKKKANMETLDEAWERIMAMKNSDTDNARIAEVRRAYNAGTIGRDSPDKRFSKAEALRMWRKLDEIKQAERLHKMVEDMPDTYWLITDKERLDEFMTLVNDESEIVFDVETTGTDVYSDYIVGHVISAVKAGIHAYIPTKHDEGDQLNSDYVNEVLRPLYEDESVGKIAHNAKFDINMLANEGITLKGLTWDTLEAMKLLNENEPTYALKPLVSKYLNDPSATYGELFGKRGFNEIPLDEATAYAAKDGDVTLRLRDFQRYHLSKMSKVLEYYENVEVPLIPIIAEMEREGYVIDREFAKEYGDELRKEADEYGRKVFAALGDINLNSPVQLKQAIEQYIGKPIENTDANQTLKPLSKDYPVIADLLKYREINKLLTTYIDALPTLIKESTGRLHTNFNQNGAKTGRFSSSGGVNLQNQSAESRKMFIAPNGYYIVNADFSAQEVRIIASESGEDVLLRAFAEGKDAYASLASEFFNKPYDECYKLPDGSDTEERKRMKVVLLMSMYGASKYGLAQALDITPDEATIFLRDFFDKYRKIDAFIKETQAYANRNGYVWIGDKQRKRRLPEAKGDMRRYDPKRNRAMRQGPNARIQGLAAIQTKVTMLNIDKVAKERGWKLFFTIHDEIGVLIPTDAPIDDYYELQRIMTESYLLDGVANGSDIEVQRRWSDSITLEEFINGKEVPKL